MDATEALAVWVAEGQIDSDLAERLRTSLAAHDEPQRTNKIIWVLVSIGAVLTGAGLLLFIASQWDQSSPLRRLALLFTIYLLVVVPLLWLIASRLVSRPKGCGSCRR